MSLPTRLFPVSARRAGVLVCAAWLAVGCATNPVTGRQDFVLMSEAEEVALGARYSKEIEKEQSPYDSERLNAYVDRIGQRLARVSHRPNLEYSFTVVDSTDVNAFALPGGHIYITRGLMAYLNSEAELAAVLGHEIGHVTARHSVRQHSASTATSVVGAILSIATGVQGSQNLFNVLGGALLRGYGRDHELEADRLGAHYLADAGYDPQAMIEVIGVLKNQELFESQRAEEEGREARSYHGVFATHPDNDTRLQQVVGEAGKVANADATYSGRDDYLAQIEGLTFGESEREGMVRDNRFLHKPLDFGLTFPSQWRIVNQADRIVGVAPDQAALLELRLRPVKADETPDAVLAALGVRDLRQGRSMPIEGAQAYTARGPVGTDLGQRTARFVVINDRASAFVFTGIAKKDSDLPKYESGFINTALSYRRLNTAERAEASSHGLAVIRSGADTRLEALAEQSPLADHALEQLRLLNDLYPTGEPQAGQRLKIVR